MFHKYLKRNQMPHFLQVHSFWIDLLHHIDRKQHVGSIMLFIKEDTPSKLLNIDTSISEIENVDEINLCSKNWLISGSYNPHLNSIQKYLLQLGKNFDFYSPKYENFIALGDFNGEMTKTHREVFCSVFNYKNLVKDLTCFENSEKPTATDHVLINHQRCFQHSGVYNTGLSDFHELSLTVLKVNHSKKNPKIIQYRDYKNFTNKHFKRDLLRELSFHNTQPNELDKFKFIASKLLNSHVPLKEKYFRCNHAAFMNKELCKTITARTRLLNKLTKFNCPENQLA